MDSGSSLFILSKGNLNSVFGYRGQRIPTENTTAVNTIIARGNVPVNSANPFDGNDDRHLRPPSSECVPPRTAETSVGIEDHGREEAEAVGGVADVFDHEEREEKLKAADSSLGPTDLPDSCWAKLDAMIKEMSSVMPPSGPTSTAGRMLFARAPVAMSGKIPPPPASIALAGQVLFFSFPRGVNDRSCDYKVR